jgi:cell division protein FtsW
MYGKFTNNAKSWIDLGFFSFQPSEFVKLAVILYFGTFFGDDEKVHNIKYSFLIPITFSIAIFILVALQPDLGTAAIIAMIVFLTFISIPLRENNLARILKIGAGALVIVLIVFIATDTPFLTEMQKKRLIYKEPCTRYTEETGYQACNGFIAINKGGLLGKGIGNSTQKYLYLPEAHTDFIFPIAVEELGLVFGVALILGYLFILYRIFKIARTSYNLKDAIICYGVMIYILSHIIINLCGILALMPLTGVPLPFLSYGGSFTINLIFSLFIVQRIAIENKIMKNSIEISKISK